VRRKDQPQAAKPPIALRTVREDAASGRALRNWYRLHARPLPWRKTLDPYAIWVSEVLLQQTQVATVIPYYHRFLQTFPTVARLAQAPLERVLEIWSGLGYYRRARHLHQAARVVTETFEGRFPADYRLARTLPGVGDYTARAVLSLAYQQPYPVLDGNVARVAARLFALRGNLQQAAFRRSVEARLHRLLPPLHPGGFNQAIMELGQMICLPRAPRCPACPIQRWCRGYRLGKPEAFPAPRRRRTSEVRHLAAAIVRQNSKIGLVRGLGEGLLDDLWNFPSAFGSSRVEALTRLEEKLSGLLKSPVVIGPPVADLHHGITFRSIRVRAYPVKFPGRTRADSLRWFSITSLPRSAISQLARKIANQVL
jgi:A/G-specific adenine glycosylase